jgi:hypothetical protein
MSKRNPNSQHQLQMKLFFGEDAVNQPSDWTKWPEPQRSIYSRMLASRLTLVKCNFVKSLKAVKNMIDEL